MNRRIQHNHTNVFLDSFESKKKIKGATILDSGSGDGYASKKFMDFGANKVYAHDPHKVIVIKDILYVQDLFRIPERSCDIIWSHHVIEHVYNPIQYLYTLWDKLKKEGELWLGCPNTATTDIFSEGHLHNFTICNLVLCLKAAGFGVSNIRWHITKGQLRIRIGKFGNDNLPKPMLDLRLLAPHFMASELPQVWRWDSE